MSIRANIPFRLNAMSSVNLTIDTAIEKAESMSTICDDGHPPSGVKMPKSCRVCGGTGPFKVGREVDGRLTPLSEADVATLAAETTAAKSEAVLTVHRAEEVDTGTLPGEAVYYALPGKGQDVQYSGLRRMVELAAEEGKVICTILGLKGPGKAWRLGLYHQVITLNEIAWPEAVRRQPDIPVIPVSEQDEESLRQALTGLETPFVASHYRNTVELLKSNMLASAAGSAPPLQAVPSTSPVNSFFEGLRADVKTGAKKAPVKKAPAKKAASKRAASTIKKTA